MTKVKTISSATMHRRPRWRRSRKRPRPRASAAANKIKANRHKLKQMNSINRTRQHSSLEAILTNQISATKMKLNRRLQIDLVMRVPRKTKRPSRTAEVLPDQEMALAQMIKVELMNQPVSDLGTTPPPERMRTTNKAIQTILSIKATRTLPMMIPTSSSPNTKQNTEWSPRSNSTCRM